MNPNCVTSFLQRGWGTKAEAGKPWLPCSKGQFYRYSQPGLYRCMNCLSVLLCPPAQRSLLNDQGPHRTQEGSTAASRNPPSRPHMASKGCIFHFQKAACSSVWLPPGNPVCTISGKLMAFFFSGPSRNLTDGLRFSRCLQGGI